MIALIETYYYKWVDYMPKEVIIASTFWIIKNNMGGKSLTICTVNLRRYNFCNKVGAMHLY